MKSILDPIIRAELIKRVNALTPQHQALWGKMNVNQMMQHCILCEDMVSGKVKVKRVFIGKIIGKMMLKKAIGNDKPFGKNAPSSPLVLSKAEGADIEHDRREWTSRIAGYEHYNEPVFVHPFFGSMNKEQLGLFAYKHNDHHLRQFGV